MKIYDANQRRTAMKHFFTVVVLVFALSCGNPPLNKNIEEQSVKKTITPTIDSLNITNTDHVVSEMNTSSEAPDSPYPWNLVHPSQRPVLEKIDKLFKDFGMPIDRKGPTNCKNDEECTKFSATCCPSCLSGRAEDCRAVPAKNKIELTKLLDGICAEGPDNYCSTCETKGNLCESPLRMARCIEGFCEISVPIEAHP